MHLDEKHFPMSASIALQPVCLFVLSDQLTLRPSAKNKRLFYSSAALVLISNRGDQVLSVVICRQLGK